MSESTNSFKCKLVVEVLYGVCILLSMGDARFECNRFVRSIVKVGNFCRHGLRVALFSEFDFDCPSVRNSEKSVENVGLVGSYSNASLTMDKLSLELLDHIISFLPDADIVKASTVSKLWRVVAIDHLRLYRKCTVHLNQDLGEIEHVSRAINSDRLHYVRRIVIKSRADARLPLLRRVYDEFVDRPLEGSVGLEYFECDLLGNEYNAAEMNFMRSMLVHHQSTLKKIVLRNSLNSAFNDFFGFLRGADGSAVYTALNEIEVLGYSFPVGLRWNSLHSEVVPNLQSIRGRSILAAGGRYLPSVLQCVREFVVPISVSPHRLASVATAVNHLRELSSIEFYCTNTMPAIALQLLPNYQRVISLNAATLEEIVICPCRFLDVIQQFDHIRFPRVVRMKYLRHMGGFFTFEDRQLFREHFGSVLMMPSLKVLEVDMRYFFMNARDRIDYRIGNLQVGPLLNVYISNYCDTYHSMWMLGSIVRRISHLTVRVQYFGLEKQMYTSSCFVDCVNLEDFTLLVSSRWLFPGRRTLAMDAFLCGISVEEVEMLKEELNHEQLVKYQFAPIRPGLQSSNLKNLYLRDEDGRNAVRYLSAISCLLVFGRCETKIYVDMDPMYLGGFDRILEYVHAELPRRNIVGGLQ